MACLDHGFHGSAEMVLDVEALAADGDHLELGLTLVSPDEDLLAYSVDRTGDEVYELRFRDLRTGTELDDVIPRTYYGGGWSADSRWFFYTVHDQAYRPQQVWRHRIGTTTSTSSRSRTSASTSTCARRAAAPSSWC